MDIVITISITIHSRYIYSYTYIVYSRTRYIMYTDIYTRTPHTILHAGLTEQARLRLQREEAPSPLEGRQKL